MIGAANPALQTRMHLMALCIDCKRFHEIETAAAYLVPEVDRWHQKHLGHNIELTSRYRKIPANLNDQIFQEYNHTPWYLQEGWQENADIKLAYEASAAYTITLASLATSSTLLAGAESAAVSNTINLYLDYGISGFITVGTTPTANTVIQVLAYGSLNDTPTYPDVFDGTASTETITNAGVKEAALVFLAILSVTTTASNVNHPFMPVSLAMTMGGFIPKNHGIFVTHNTGVNLNATGGNHAIHHTGVYRTV